MNRAQMLKSYKLSRPETVRDHTRTRRRLIGWVVLILTGVASALWWGRQGMTMPSWRGLAGGLPPKYGLVFNWQEVQEPAYGATAGMTNGYFVGTLMGSANLPLPPGNQSAALSQEFFKFLAAELEEYYAPSWKEGDAMGRGAKKTGEEVKKGSDGDITTHHYEFREKTIENGGKDWFVKRGPLSVETDGRNFIKILQNSVKDPKQTDPEKQQLLANGDSKVLERFSISVELKVVHGNARSNVDRSPDHLELTYQETFKIIKPKSGVLAPLYKLQFKSFETLTREGTGASGIDDFYCLLKEIEVGLQAGGATNAPANAATK